MDHWALVGEKLTAEKHLAEDARKVWVLHGTPFERKRELQSRSNIYTVRSTHETPGGIVRCCRNYAAETGA